MLKSPTSTRAKVALVLFAVFTAVGIGASAAFSATSVAAPTLTQTPSSQTTLGTARFAFSGPARATFACKLDTGAYAACSSPKDYANLAEGRHTFAVTATVGKDTSSATTYSWTVDRTPPPVPSITGKPAALSTSTGPTFSFTDAEAGVAFGCSLDGGAFNPCSSPRTYNTLAQGAHTFAVRASDGLGNTSAAATYGWKVDSFAPPAPYLTQKAPDPTYQATNTFAWTDADRDPVTFQCSLENGAWFACTTPYSWAIRTDNYGQHQFGVRAIDPAGNVSPATYWVFKYQKGLPDQGVPFTISGSVTGLAPGVTRPVAVTITNPNTVGIYVSALQVKFDATKDPAGCSSSTNFVLTQSDLSSTKKVYVAAKASLSLPAQGVSAPTIQMRNLTTNQDSCKAKSLALTYSGTATN